MDRKTELRNEEVDEDDADDDDGDESPFNILNQIFYGYSWLHTKISHKSISF